MPEKLKLDSVQKAAQEQFAKQSGRYGKGHILENVSDVKAALDRITLPKVADALDIATGAGHTGLFLASLGHRVTVADLAEPMLKRVSEEAARRGLSVSLRQHAAEQFPYPDHSFDLVTCRVAGHHFSSPEKFISETARVLRPRGSLLLIDGSVPDSAPIAEEWIHQVEKLRDPSHHRFLTPGAWGQLCEGHGLQVQVAELTPFKQPDLEWYFQTAATPEPNRAAVLELVRTAPAQAGEVFKIAHEDGKIVWWWPRLTLIANKI